MPVIDKHAPGSFCWAELATTDAAAAKSFYSGLFGWAYNDIPMGPDAFYTMILVQDKEAGALYAKSADQPGPPHWNVYFAVEKADDAAARAVRLGGKVIAGPFDVFESGRMAALQDPTGAIFSVWQPRNHIGARIIYELGTPSWPELATRDTAAAEAFYSALLGWKTKPSSGYTEWTVQGQSIGGMMAMDEKWGQAPPHWMVYFMVADCDATANKAAQSGGTVCVPPTDIPNVGRFSVLGDPQGAYFSIIQMAGAAAHP